MELGPDRKPSPTPDPAFEVATKNFNDLADTLGA